MFNAILLEKFFGKDANCRTSHLTKKSINYITLLHRIWRHTHKVHMHTMRISSLFLSFLYASVSQKTETCNLETIFTMCDWMWACWVCVGVEFSLSLYLLMYINSVAHWTTSAMHVKWVENKKKNINKKTKPTSYCTMRSCKQFE